MLWKALAAGLLLALGLSGRRADGQGNGRGTKEVLGSSVFYLGQSGDTWRPLARTTVNFSDITSIKSSFQFRTFDPEGVIFYGDTKGGEDWFVLALKDGVPLMQIRQLGTLVSVAGGPKLNDGEWHTLEVSNRESFVILEVDGSGGLVVGMKAEQPEEVIQGDLRLALGGILIGKEKLNVQFEPQMDGCVRGGVWLNLSVPWETEAEELWPCHQDVQPGSYFPGTGLALFTTSAFAIGEEDKVKIELQGNFSLMNGTVLSVRAPGQDVMFALVANKDAEEVTLTYGELTMRMSSALTAIWIKFQEGWLAVKTEEGLSRSASVTPARHPAYRAAWTAGDFAVGGLLGGADGGASDFLTGCLTKIRVQEKDLDLDLAVKHVSVSSHSCPA